MAVKAKVYPAKMLAVSALWLLVWSVTHGFFMSPNFMQLIPGELNMQYFIASVYILVVTVLSLVLYPKAKTELPRSKLLYLYSIPLIILILLPFHYQLELHVFVYIFMVIVTCFWQDFLTFGLYQTAINKVASQRITVFVVASVFTIGHIIFFLNELTFGSILSWTGILVAALAFAAIKVKTGNIYLINILHLSFLLLFV